MLFAVLVPQSFIFFQSSQSASYCCDSTSFLTLFSFPSPLFFNLEKRESDCYVMTETCLFFSSQYCRKPLGSEHQWSSSLCFSSPRPLKVVLCVLEGFLLCASIAEGMLEIKEEDWTQFFSVLVLSKYGSVEHSGNKQLVHHVAFWVFII